MASPVSEFVVTLPMSQELILQQRDSSSQWWGGRSVHTVEAIPFFVPDFV